MARFLSHFASSAAVVAALSMVATPALAAAIPHTGQSLASGFHASPSWSPEAETAHHGWGGRGWHDRGGVSAGDVLAGVLLIGGIAAIASAASKSNRDRDYRSDYPDYPAGDAYRDPPQNYDSRPVEHYRSGGMDNAVNMCVDEIERGQDRVASVDNAARNGDGWSVSGQLETGSRFTCSIDNDGRLGGLDFSDADYRSGSGDPGYQGDDQGAYRGGQWNDDAYARARARTGSPSPDSYQPSDENVGG